MLKSFFISAYLITAITQTSTANATQDLTPADIGELVAVVVNEALITPPGQSPQPVTKTASGIVVGDGQYLLTARHILYHCLKRTLLRGGIRHIACDPAKPSSRDRYYPLNHSSRIRLVINGEEIAAEVAYPNILEISSGGIKSNEILEDFALLHIKEASPVGLRQKNPHLCAEFSFYSSANTDTVTAVGFSSDQSLIQSKGLVLGVTEDPFIITSARTEKGMSGGPVINNNGEIIGVIRSHAIQSNISLITPAPLIAQRLNKTFPNIETTANCKLAIEPAAPSANAE